MNPRLPITAPASRATTSRTAMGRNDATTATW